MDVQKLLELRKMLEEKISKLQEEVKFYTALLEMLDKAIGEKSFTTAAQQISKTEVAAATRPEAVEQIKGRGGEVYATVEVYDNYLYIKFREPVRLDSLFKRFFLDKFLQKYRDEDAAEARRGSIKQDEVLRYELEEGAEGEVAGIKIYNYRTPERRREILRVLRWTLEKVYSG
ncbi:MAG: hypothetical protein OWQ51_07850 [Pyrobaculum arsenaticum]|uniref:Uncharacterized protein n=2 Tax=Pyrobaculum arsenaticum TaxID=121277 RepID=A0A7L4P9T1_9CREN|nr:hypothetical protein [Pyrobaculum arsenaticum]MCY0890875.1 hypothetical protein [Pyrobaculum arsenaticum]NYR15678.1 hypothetical protein [Pyrobaculum arsenaticum]